MNKDYLPFYNSLNDKDKSKLWLKEHGYKEDIF